MPELEPAEVTIRKMELAWEAAKLGDNTSNSPDTRRTMLLNAFAASYKRISEVVAGDTTPTDG